MEEQSEQIDRISALPELVFHHLFSFLSNKDIKVISVLSKNWYRICRLAPLVEFNESCFAEGPDIYPTTEEAREKFVNHVSETLGRFQENNLRITRLGIRITLAHPRLVQLLDGWIRLVLDRGVEELDLYTGNRGDIVPYNVPQGVFFAKSIKKANLALCSFLQSFPRDDIIDSRNSQLQKLCLDRVRLDEHSLRSIISNCPLIEELSMIACPGIKKVQISHLCKLKSLFISSWDKDEIKMIEIDASSLQSFELKVFGDYLRPRKISILECPCLMELILYCVDVEDTWLQNLVSRLSSLRKLVLHYCNLPELLKISSDSLNSLEMQRCSNLIWLEIEAPNLFSFCLIDGTVPKLLISSMHPISQWEVTFFLFGKFRLLDTEFFFKLQNFISHPNHFGHLHLVLNNNKVTFSTEESKDRADQPAPEVKHLTLEGVSPLSCPNILDGLLWTCHPHSMSFLLEPEERNDALTFVRDILVHRDCVACCFCSHARSWLKHLQDVTVVSDEGVEDQWLINGNISSYSLQSNSSSEIIFMFKW